MTYDNDVLKTLKSTVDGLFEDVDRKSENKTPLSLRERLKLGKRCRCSFEFSMPLNCSADLPEGILRKIIQRNFPESSKSIELPSGSKGEPKVCPTCKGAGTSSKDVSNDRLFLETPSNATEVLRGCGPSTSSGLQNPNSFEALIAANHIVELPMPR